MAKQRMMFVCGACGAEYPKWIGQCEKCGEWNTLSDAVPLPKPNATGHTPTGTMIDFHSTPLFERKHQRISTGFHETDRVLGTGFFPDSLTLFVGNPGIGKSTLALQIAINIARSRPQEPVMVFSGEESAYQVKDRAERLGSVPENLLIASAFVIEDVVTTVLAKKPAFVIVDSAQTFSSHEIPGAPASLAQIRAVTEKLMQVSKTHGIPVLLIGQVTKGGEMAGPQLLAHLVDAVLQFEGDDQHELRIVRSLKNRYGSTSEVGIFEMTETGLKEVKNPSSAFLSG